jgi:hypothetical protein
MLAEGGASLPVLANEFLWVKLNAAMLFLAGPAGSALHILALRSPS